MSDTGTSTSTPSRKAVADRQWVDASGQEVTDEAKATGFRYVDLATKKAFVWQSNQAPGTPVTMLAIFGGLTKAGNVRNTLINGAGGDPNADPIEAISDWFALLESGQWAEERVGGVGARFNKETLAKAIAQVAGHAEGSPFHQQRLARLQNNDKVQDPDKKEGTMILYGTFALRNKAVRDAYEAMSPAKATQPDVGTL